ncbi:hypothetical protein [Priestia aryabhattai]|uniref:hypothetical protein n=1 Tax=Priestia aryabhattai TaxID=412384 RepID=UPI001C8EC69D|nr:hypothetical protein [Priestia aryabhattai]MBX9998154.1 hypothetical protein [Priestia aryabhattai]
MLNTKKGTFYEKNFLSHGELIKDISNQNIPQVVLKGHLHIERALENIIRESFENPNLLLTEKSMFSNKLSLVSALGIVPHEYTVALKYFNKIRNKFSHDLEFKLEEEELAQLVNRLDSKTKEFYEGLLRQDTPEEDEYMRYISLFPYKLMFVVISLFVKLIEYHRSYLTDPIVEELFKLHILKKEILGKDEDFQKAYIDDRYNELEKTLHIFYEENLK